MYDISLPLSTALPVWPGDPPFRLNAVSRLAQGDSCEVSAFSMGTHCGTHVDAPAHFIPAGKKVEELPLETFIGPADVVYIPDTALITAAHLDAARQDITSERLLLKTHNSFFWENSPDVFHEDFCALSPDAAAWIVEKRIRLVGIDYLSIEPFSPPEPDAVHKTLLCNEVAILEGLNLSKVPPGRYHLVCLPLALAAVEGAPARAVLLPL